MDIIPQLNVSSIQTDAYFVQNPSFYTSQAPCSLKKTANTSHFSTNQNVYDGAEISHSENAQNFAPLNLGSNTIRQATFNKPAKKIIAKLAKEAESKRIKRAHRFKQRVEAGEINQSLPIKNRVGMCGRVRADSKKKIYVKYNGKNAFVSNILQCGSGWLCSVCHSKINAERGKQVTEARKKWQEIGGHVVMMTVTCRHAKGDDLKDLLEKLKLANEYIWSHSAIKSLFSDQLSKKGHIKNLEITYSDKNGFHPHNHYALFLPISLEVLLKHDVSYCFDENGFIKYVSPYTEKVMINKGLADDIKVCTVEYFLKHFWIKASVHVGLRAPSFENGLSLSCADNIESYLTKDNDSLGHELTNTFSKDSIDQFNLLDMSMAGDKQSAKLFQIFALATHGERQLNWSRNLKKELGIDELTDDELLEEAEIDQEPEVLAEIELPVWNLICKYNLHAELLNKAEYDVLHKTTLLLDLLNDLADEVAVIRQSYLSRYT